MGLGSGNLRFGLVNISYRNTSCLSGRKGRVTAAEQQKSQLQAGICLFDSKAHQLDPDDPWVVDLSR